MNIEAPDTLYLSQEELEQLTSEDLIQAHNNIVDFLVNVQNDVNDQIELLNHVRIKKAGLEDEVEIVRVPRERR